MTRPLDFKVVFDAAGPHRLAAFWAEALGYVVEDNSALVRSVLDAGQAGDDDVTTVDGRLAWRTVAAVRHPGDPVQDFTGVGRRILFAAVPEVKTVKNRVHLDLHVGPDRMHEEAERLCGLGAALLREVDEPSGHWLVLADPEGNELCVA